MLLHLNYIQFVGFNREAVNIERCDLLAMAFTRLYTLDSYVPQWAGQWFAAVKPHFESTLKPPMTPPQSLITIPPFLLKQYLNELSKWFEPNFESPFANPPPPYHSSPYQHSYLNRHTPPVHLCIYYTYIPLSWGVYTREGRGQGLNI